MNLINFYVIWQLTYKVQLSQKKREIWLLSNYLGAG